jgi:hypothetical protein
MEESKIVAESKPDDPVKVAKHGYEALMRGDDTVRSNVMSDKAETRYLMVIPCSKRKKTIL